MKKQITFYLSTLLIGLFAICALPIDALAQDDPSEKKKEKPVRNPWEVGYVIESQNDYVLSVKTLEMIMQHRFGNFGNETFNLAGIYGASNIRIGFNYGILKNAQIGFGTEKNGLAQDLNWKYKILTQTKSNSMPIAMSYYGNIEYSAKPKADFGSEAEYKGTHRMAYFNQLMISRKFNKRITAMVAATYAHYNQIDTASINGLEHDNFGFVVAGRVKVAPSIYALVEYEHPLTTPDVVQPNLSFGLEFMTSAHAFQVFVTTYNGISYQNNLVYNTNDFSNKGFRFGFNMTRNWNL